MAFSTISELALLLSVTAVMGILARLLRQPMILAYLLVGVIVGATGWLPVAHNPLYQTFSQLGVTLLLFLVGLEINVSSLRRVGPAALVLGLGQVVITFVGGFFLALLLGLTVIPAAYVAIALTFSSTVIVVKLLAERQDLNSLYGKLSLGVLVVQDVMAILLLVILAGLGSSGSVSAWPVISTVAKAIVFFGLAWWLGRALLPKLFAAIAHSEELLFLSSLAWVFFLATVVTRLGLSMEIGGLLAGLSLANSFTHFQIASRIRPLRDFFLVLFFIVLGSTVAVANVGGLLWPIVVLSLFVLVGNPVIVLVLMSWLGYHRRTSFLTSVTVSQVSEFSFILALLGFQLGHLGQSEVTLITAVGVITIVCSSYLITHGQRLYGWLEPAIALVHHNHAPREIDARRRHRPFLLVGAHRVGQSVAVRLPKKSLLVVDDDPDMVAQLQSQQYAVLFGDVSDHDLLDQVDFRSLKLIVSTVPNLQENLSLLEYHRRHPRRGRRIIVRAETAADAQALYARGADYVLRPHITAGQFLGQSIAADPTLKHLAGLRRHDQRALAQAILFPV